MYDILFRHINDITYLSKWRNNGIIKTQKGREMIITVGGIKGGCGKSLISTNLTVMRALKGKRVLLVDADEQGTSGDWTDHRTELGVETPWTTVRLKSNSVRTEIKKMMNNYDDIIIDCGGRDTASLRAALTVSDIFLVPFQPKSFDIWTTDKVSNLISEAMLNSIIAVMDLAFAKMVMCLKSLHITLMLNSAK